MLTEHVKLCHRIKNLSHDPALYSRADQQHEWEKKKKAFVFSAPVIWTRVRKVFKLMNQISVAELKVIINSVVNNSIRIRVRFNVKEVFTYEEFILVRKNEKEKKAGIARNVI